MRLPPSYTIFINNFIPKDLLYHTLLACLLEHLCKYPQQQGHELVYHVFSCLSSNFIHSSSSKTDYFKPV